MDGYLLDTNICIYLLKGQRRIVDRIETVGCNMTRRAKQRKIPNIYSGGGSNVATFFRE